MIYVDTVDDVEVNWCIAMDFWWWIVNSMSLVSSWFSDEEDEDDAIIRRICATYSSLIWLDDRTGNDVNGFSRADDEPNRYIDEHNGSGGTIDKSWLFTKRKFTILNCNTVRFRRQKKMYVSVYIWLYIHLIGKFQDM